MPTRFNKDDVILCDHCGQKLEMRPVELAKNKIWWVGVEHDECQKRMEEIFKAMEPIRQEIRRAESEVFQKNHNDKKREKAFEYSGFNPQNKVFEKAKIHPAIERPLEKVKKWTMLDKGFYLEGPNGVGKSFLLAALANQLIDAGIRVQFLRFGRMMREYFALDDFYEKEIFIKHYREVPVLFLDDLGSEKFTEFGESVLFDILEERYEQRRAVHVSSNVGIEDMSDVFSPRVYSRLRAMIEVVHVGGTDVRKHIPWKVDDDIPF